MSKTMNTDLKFTTDTESAKIGDNPNSFTTTTGTSSSTAFNYSDLMRCKYYLPCGRCDKTGELCTYYTTPTYPYYPYPYKDWWNWGPTWIYSDDTSTNEVKTTTTYECTAIRQGKIPTEEN